MIKLYVLWSIIYFPIIIYNTLKSNNSILYSFVEYLKKFIFVGSYTHLWYINALIISVAIISFLLYKKISPLKILFFSFALYIIGLFGNSWFSFLLPIKEKMPTIWSILGIMKDVMNTTRNGIFFGFFFVSLGMSFAHYGNRVSKKRAIIGFSFSMLFLGGEILFLRYNHLPTLGDDMFFFLFPATYFFFSYFEQLALFGDDDKYIKLRAMSSLVFFTHLWIAFLFDVITKVFYMSIKIKGIKYLFVVFITIIISNRIYWLSMKDRYKFLRKLYK